MTNKNWMTRLRAGRSKTVETVPVIVDKKTDYKDLLGNPLTVKAEQKKLSSGRTIDVSITPVGSQTQAWEVSAEHLKTNPDLGKVKPDVYRMLSFDQTKEHVDNLTNPSGREGKVVGKIGTTEAFIKNNPDLTVVMKKVATKQVLSENEQHVWNNYNQTRFQKKAKSPSKRGANLKSGQPDGIKGRKLGAETRKC